MPECLLSILIVNYNSGDFLKCCLDSLAGQLEGIDHEIRIVDNGSTDGSIEKMREAYPGVRIMINRSNLGFAKAINQALMDSSGKYCLWLNPDAGFQEGSLREVLDFLERESAVGVAGLRIVNPDGSIQLSCRAFPSYRTALFNRYSLLTRLFPSNPVSREYLNSQWAHDTVREVDWVSGAALLHRRELIHQIGLLDERFFMYCEDVDFCHRAKQAGWKVIYHPGVSITHHIGVSSRKIPFRMIYERHRSMWMYYQKYFRPNLLKNIPVVTGVILRGLCLAIIEIFRKK